MEYKSLADQFYTLSNSFKNLYKPMYCLSTYISNFSIEQQRETRDAFASVNMHSSIFPYTTLSDISIINKTTPLFISLENAMKSYSKLHEMYPALHSSSIYNINKNLLSEKQFEILKVALESINESPKFFETNLHSNDELYKKFIELTINVVDKLSKEETPIPKEKYSETRNEIDSSKGKSSLPAFIYNTIMLLITLFSLAHDFLPDQQLIQIESSVQEIIQIGSELIDLKEEELSIFSRQLEEEEKQTQLHEDQLEESKKQTLLLEQLVEMQNGSTE